jgi:hypothetical protein
MKGRRAFRLLRLVHWFNAQDLHFWDGLNEAKGLNDLNFLNALRE